MIRQMAEVYVERERGGFNDRFRAYRVVLDGETVGRVKRGESLSLTTNPGEHELYFAIDWCRSPRKTLELTEEGTVSVRCWPKANPLTGIFFITLGRARYIAIEIDSHE
jgi:hypothetical protein